MGEVPNGSCLGQSDHEAVRFIMYANVRKTDTKTSTLDMKRADLRLFRETVRFPGKKLLKVLGSSSVVCFLSTTY